MTTAPDTLTIVLNGEPRDVAIGMTIADLAALIGLDATKVAVERNREIVPRSTLAATVLKDGDALEIVHFVGGGMGVSRIVPNRFAADPQAGQSFFNDVLGLETAMTLDFITTYRSGEEGMAQINIISEDPSGLKPAYSVGVDNVDACHERAVAAGHDIVYALRDEQWGVRRFFVRDPLGDIANIVQNKDGM